MGFDIPHFMQKNLQQKTESYVKNYFNLKLFLQKRTEFDENYLTNLIFRHNNCFSE